MIIAPCVSFVNICLTTQTAKTNLKITGKFQWQVRQPVNEHCAQRIRYNAFFYARSFMVGVRGKPSGLPVSTAMLLPVCRPAYIHHPCSTACGDGSNLIRSVIMQKHQDKSHLRLVRPIQPAVSHKAPLKICAGTIWGWRAGQPAPLTIRLDNGQQFACGGLSTTQQSAFDPDQLLGKKVEFFHQGFNRHGLPIAPSFKTILTALNGGLQ